MKLFYKTQLELSKMQAFTTGSFLCYCLGFPLSQAELDISLKKSINFIGNECWNFSCLHCMTL